MSDIIFETTQLDRSYDDLGFSSSSRTCRNWTNTLKLLAKIEMQLHTD